jgi:hypothetical protein
MSRGAQDERRKSISCDEKKQRQRRNPERLGLIQR